MKTLLQLACKLCGARFESGIPLEREHVEGVKLRTLEVCPHCDAAADYSVEDYLDVQVSPKIPGSHG